MNEKYFDDAIKTALEVSTGSDNLCEKLKTFVKGIYIASYWFANRDRINNTINYKFKTGSFAVKNKESLATIGKHYFEIKHKNKILLKVSSWSRTGKLFSLDEIQKIDMDSLDYLKSYLDMLHSKLEVETMEIV